MGAAARSCSRADWGRVILSPGKLRGVRGCVGGVTVNWDDQFREFPSWAMVEVYERDGSMGDGEASYSS